MNIHPSRDRNQAFTGHLHFLVLLPSIFPYFTHICTTLYEKKTTHSSILEAVRALVQSMTQLWVFRAFPGDVGCPHREGRPWRVFKRIPYTQLRAGKILNSAQLPLFAKELLRKSQDVEASTWKHPGLQGTSQDFDNNTMRFNAWKLRSDKSQSAVQFPSREGHWTLEDLARVWILLLGHCCSR